MFRNLKLFNDWYASLNDDQRSLFGRYLQIRRSEGASWPDILKELISHLPDILAFITAIVNLFHHPAMVLLAVALLTGSAFGQASPPVARIAEPPRAVVSQCCDCCVCRDAECRCAFPGECLYAAAYRVSLTDGRPLVVFVGQNERSIVGCRTCEVPHFPGVAAPAVVIGVPDRVGTMDRIDVPGRADIAKIRERVSPCPRCESGFCPAR